MSSSENWYFIDGEYYILSGKLIPCFDDFQLWYHEHNLKNRPEYIVLYRVHWDLLVNTPVFMIDEIVHMSIVWGDGD